MTEQLSIGDKAKPRKKEVVTTGALMAAMRERFDKQAYALMFEVGNATGYRTNRHADAIAMSLWPSKGLHIHGFELKCSRSDWLRELKDPSKADTFFTKCHTWSLVSGPDIVQPGELSPEWGHYVLAGGKFRCVKEPPIRDVAPTWSFVAALMRQAAEIANAPRPEEVDRNKVLDDARREAFANGVASVQAIADTQQKRADDLAARISLFEAESGVTIPTWQSTPHTGVSKAAEKYRAYLALRQNEADLKALLSRVASGAERIASYTKDLEAQLAGDAA